MTKCQLNARYKYNNRDYVIAMSDGLFIDAEIKGNLSRYVSHSCDPDCEAQKWIVNGETRIGIFTKRDVKANDELTIDYDLKAFGNVFACACGAQN